MVVENGTPFLFNDADGSATRLGSFPSDSQTNVSTEIFVMHDQISICSCCFNNEVSEMLWMFWNSKVG